MEKTVISEDRRFEWYGDKSKTNKDIHGLHFEEIFYAFDAPYILELYDEAHSTVDETRYRGLAGLQDFIILYLLYTEPESGRPLIISERPAEPIEERM